MAQLHELAEVTSVDDEDMLLVRDVSDTTDGPDGTDKFVRKVNLSGVLDSAIGLVSHTFTGTTLTDVIGVQVSPYCSGKPLVLEVSGLGQISLNGAAAGSLVGFQIWVVDELNRQWWMTSIQGSVTSTVTLVSTISSRITIPNIIPGRHSFKMACKMTNANGQGQLFGGSFGGDPTFEINLTARELI